MQICEQRVRGAQQLHLCRLGLLDLQHQLGLLEHGLVVSHDPRPLCEKLLVGDRRALPRPGLHHHLVPAGAQFPDSCGRDRNAVLVRLDLGRNADDHRSSSRPRRASQNSMRSRALVKSRPVSASIRRMR